MSLRRTCHVRAGSRLARALAVAPAILVAGAPAAHTQTFEIEWDRDTYPIDAIVATHFDLNIDKLDF